MIKFKYEYTVYGTDECVWCRKATQLLSKKRLTYAYQDVRSDERLLSWFKDQGHTTVPQVYNWGTLVGGYSELVAHLEEEDQSV